MIVVGWWLHSIQWLASPYFSAKTMVNFEYQATCRGTHIIIHLIWFDCMPDEARTGGNVVLNC